MNIGTQIQTLRKQRGITQEILAEEMGVTVGAVSSFICDTVRELLEKAGYRCAGLAENGVQLYVLMDEKVPDILFLDINLKEESGLTLLKEIKQKEMPVKVIVLTADKAEETKRTAMDYGADAYLTKPFLPQQIITTLDFI